MQTAEEALYVDLHLVRLAGCQKLRRQYTGGIMDRVRFGRALGYGARHAAKSLKKAAEAASAPSPSRPAGGASTARPGVPRAEQPAVSQVAQPVASRVSQRVVQTQRTVATTKTQARSLGRSVWKPLAQFSSVLWLQVTGTFFTLLALFLSGGLWKQRDVMRLPISSHVAEKFYVHLLAFAIFAYFAISNFVRAHLRGRR